VIPIAGRKEAAMHRRHSFRLGLPATVFGVAVTLFAHHADAAEPVSSQPPSAARAGAPQDATAEPAKSARACLAAYENGQEQVAARRLRTARALFAACSFATCGPALRQQCGARFAQVDSDIPTIVPVATDASGARRADVEVKMDGEILASRLDGQALPVEPGLHEFSFGVDGGVIATKKALILEGEHDRVVAVSIERPREQEGTTAGGSAPPSARPASSAGRTTLPLAAEADVASLEDRPNGGATAVAWALAGVGVAGLGAGATLFVFERKKALGLAVDSAGVGVGALGAAIWIFASPRRAEPRAGNPAGYTFDVHPMRSGAMATFSRRF
jgi:hypothetical protein